MNVSTPSWRESRAVWSLLESSTRILMSTTSDSSRTVCSSVFSALYAGITTATRFPLIMIPTPEISVLSHPGPVADSVLLDHGRYFCNRVRHDCCRRCIRLHQPDGALLVVVHQLQIIGCVHLSCPYDFGTIDISEVVDPFVQRIVVVRIADDRQLLAG